jgi:hypothetical protein
MKGPRTTRDARMQAHVAIAEAAGVHEPDLDEDVRRIVPKWSEVEELVEGARARGWSDAQIDYLTAVVGITWTKAFHAGERAANEALSREAVKVMNGGTT